MADGCVLPPTGKKSSNKIRDIVRLQQMLKKWKKAATAKNNNNNDHMITNNNNNNNNNIIIATAAAAATNGNNCKSSSSKLGLNKFLKKTLSFSDGDQQQQEEVVRKGYLAVWVGREEDAMKKKFVIPTDYLAHEAFSVLLRDAEEEFGFQQEGILNIPCDVTLFEKILINMNNNKKTLKSSSSTSSFFLYDEHQDHNYSHHRNSTFDSSSNSQLNTPPTTPTHNLPLYCR